MPNAYIPMLLVAWLISQFFFIIFHYKDFKPFSKSNIPNLLLVLFFIWCIITTLYSENKDQAMNMLEYRLALILAPILLMFRTQISINKHYPIFFFLLGNLVSITFCLFQYIKFGFWGSPEIRYTNLSLNINEFKHYNYFGINLSVGLVLLLYLVKEKKTIQQLYILLPAALIYITFIFFSQARMSLFIILLTSAIIFINIILQYKNFIIRLSLSVLLLFSLSSVLIKNPRLVAIQDLQEMSIKKIDVNRDKIWKESIQLIKERPIFGYGLGDTTIKIENYGLYNSHNQILDFFLEGGIISNILFFSCWILVFFIKVPQTIKFYSISISLLFFIALLTESLLNRIAGISLFIFVYYIFENSENNLKTSEISVYLKIIHTIILLVIIILIPITFLVFKKFEFNPKNPRTYLERQFNLIPYELLPNKIPAEIMVGTKGCKIDNSSFSKSWNGNTYSYNVIARLNVSTLDSLEASIYCFVSSDFDGTWVRLSCEGSSVSNIASFYNLEIKNTWQKLTIKPNCNDGIVPIFFYVAKNDCSTFRNLHGYVVFVYPEIAINGVPHK